jgi:guanylate kinase
VGETDHVQYHFVTREAFEEAILRAEMLEYTEYCGNYYGTPKSELHKTEDGRHLILEIEVEGARNVKRIYPRAVSVFIAPPSLEILEARLRGRGTNTEEDIRNRMRTAMAELGRIVDYDYVVVNEDGMAEAAAEQIYQILKSEQLRVGRNGKLLARLAPSL